MSTTIKPKVFKIEINKLEFLDANGNVTTDMSKAQFVREKDISNDILNAITQLNATIIYSVIVIPSGDRYKVVVLYS